MACSRPFLFLCCLLLTTAAGMEFVWAGEPSPLPTRSEVSAVLAAGHGNRPSEETPRALTIVLLSDQKDHGPGEHDYPRWQSRWALLLGGSAASTEKAANLAGPDLPDASLAKGAKNVRVVTAREWPDSDQWATADLVVAFCYLAWSDQRIGQVRQYLERGGGFWC